MKLPLRSFVSQLQVKIIFEAIAYVSWKKIEENRRSYEPILKVTVGIMQSYERRHYGNLLKCSRHISTCRRTCSIPLHSHRTFSNILALCEVECHDGKASSWSFQRYQWAYATMPKFFHPAFSVRHIWRHTCNVSHEPHMTAPQSVPYP